jgi:hypothetical protein
MQTFTFTQAAEKLALEFYINDELSPYGNEALNGVIKWEISLDIRESGIKDIIVSVEECDATLYFEVDEPGQDGGFSERYSKHNIQIPNNRITMNLMPDNTSSFYMNKVSIVCEKSQNKYLIKSMSINISCPLFEG